MPDDPVDDGGSVRSLATLKRVALAIDAPLHAFFDGTADADLDPDKLELLRLWDKTPRGAGRHRILAVARQEVARHREILARSTDPASP